MPHRNTSLQFRCVAVLSLALLGPICCCAASAPPVAPLALPTELQARVRQQRASVVLLDLQQDAQPLSLGPPARGLPGSAIKPLLLQYALSHGIVQPGTTAYCRRTLRIGKRSLPCTHPADRAVFDAETALADSCNTWFAQMGERFTTRQLQAAYASYGLPSPPLGTLPVAERQLRTLGLSGSRFSPQELASAFAVLLRTLQPGSPVALGLQGSITFGMAHPAALAGVTLLGKTGTASDPGQVRTHGWFVGALPGRLLVVIYVPQGDGGTAAGLARQVFAADLPPPPGGTRP